MSGDPETLAQARAQIETALKTVEDVTLFDHVPDRIGSNSIIVIPGPYPYLSEGAQFGTYTVSYAVAILLRAGTQARIVTDLDARIEDVLVALANAGIAATEVGVPYSYKTADATFLAADVSTKLTIRL